MNLDGIAYKPAPLVSLRNISKGWQAGRKRIAVLHNVSLDIHAGESVAIVGPSGAGKSTLLHILALLTPADEGYVAFSDQRIDSSRGWWDLGLRQNIGMIFQDAKLLPNLSVLQNVCVPLAHRGIWPARQHLLARHVLEEVGLGHRLDHKPNQLSGGELMRTAIARALVTQPRLLLADEPTGTLDSKTGAKIAELLFSTVTSQRALVIVTHHLPLASQADRQIVLEDGCIAN